MKVKLIYLATATLFLCSGLISSAGATELLLGDLIVTDYNGAFGGYGGTSPPGSGLVLKVDPTTGAQTIVSSGTSAAWFDGIVVAATGDIFVSELYYNNGIIQVDPLTGAQTFLSQGGNFQDPYGLDIDLAGDIIAADANWFSEGKVIKIDPNAGVQTLISSGGLLVDPSGVVVYEGLPPEPDVKANGSDDPVVLTMGDSLSIDISLDAGDVRLPPGLCAFYFGVDTTMNGVLDGDLYYDAVEVAILP